jgi:hypothetical protein
LKGERRERGATVAPAIPLLHGRRMASVKRACVWLGAAATLSLFLSLAVMLLLFEAPQVATWFGASAVLAGLAFATAVLAHWLER